VSGAARTNHVSEIRWAETGDMGHLPNLHMPNTFTAMAYGQSVSINSHILDRTRDIRSHAPWS
jgi:hypothetical protein